MEARQHATKQPMSHYKKKIKVEIQKYLVKNENGNTMIQKLWNTAKAVLRAKFI